MIERPWYYGSKCFVEQEGKDRISYHWGRGLIAVTSKANGMSLQPVFASFRMFRDTQAIVGDALMKWFLLGILIYSLSRIFLWVLETLWKRSRIGHHIEQWLLNKEFPCEKDPYFNREHLRPKKSEEESWTTKKKSS